MASSTPRVLGSLTPYDRVVRHESAMASEASNCDARGLEALTTEELWYHYSATSKMYLDQGRPLPSRVREWAREQVVFAETMAYLNPTTYANVPILKLVCIYGIHFGVHGELEQYYLATGRVNHDNVAFVAKRLTVLLCMRDHLNRHWDQMILEGVTQAGPTVTRGDYTVRCNFSTLGSYVAGVDSSRLVADMTCDTALRSGNGGVPETHPFRVDVDLEGDTTLPPAYLPPTPSTG